MPSLRYFKEGCRSGGGGIRHDVSHAGTVLAGRLRAWLSLSRAGAPATALAASASANFFQNDPKGQTWARRMALPVTDLGFFHQRNWMGPNQVSQTCQPP